MLGAGGALGYSRGLCCIPLEFLGGCFCGLRFVCVCVCVLGGLQLGRGSWPFPDCDGACGLCLTSVGWRVCASRSKVSPAGKLQWHFTCGFDFRHNVWLPSVAAFAVLKELMSHYSGLPSWRESTREVGPLHPPWYLNFHTRHEVVICTIYTPCKKMAVDDVIT